MKKFRCHILAAVLAGVIAIILCPFSFYTFIHTTDVVLPYLLGIYCDAFLLIILIRYCLGFVKRNRIRIEKALRSQDEPEEINNLEFRETNQPFSESGFPVSSAFSHPFGGRAVPEKIPLSDSRNRRP